MKKIAVVVEVIAVMLFAGLAGAEEMAPAFTGSLDIGWYSQYVDELSGATNFNKPVFQPSATLSHKSGVYLNLWDSYSPMGGLIPISGMKLM